MMSPRGSGLIEALVALPVLLFLGLAVLQLGLLLEARIFAERAADRGAQAGARSKADPNAIAGAMAEALAPVMLREKSLQGGGRGVPEALAVGPRARLALVELQLRQLYRWRWLAPTPEAFADWAESASGAMEPPTSLHSGPVRRPRSGTSRMLGPWPVGQRSGQAEFEAKRLELEVAWAVPLRIPLAGPVLRRALQQYLRCSVAAVSAACLALRDPQSPRMLIVARGSAQLQSAVHERDRR